MTPEQAVAKTIIALREQSGYTKTEVAMAIGVCSCRACKQ